MLGITLKLQAYCPQSHNEKSWQELIGQSQETRDRVHILSS